MTELNSTHTKRETLNIRIKPEERSLIDRAASMRGKNRTDFILEAARLAAEEALLEQVVIMASPEAYAEFLTRLDMPPQPNERLRKTMQTPAPWCHPLADRSQARTPSRPPLYLMAGFSFLAVLPCCFRSNPFPRCWLRPNRACHPYGSSGVR